MVHLYNRIIKKEWALCILRHAISYDILTVTLRELKFKKADEEHYI